MKGPHADDIHGWPTDSDVNKARGAKAKAENAKVIFPVNAKVNPVFQFRVIFAVL